MERPSRALFALLVAGAVSQAGVAAPDEPVYNVCEQQIRHYLTEHYGQTVKRIEFRYRDKGSPTSFANLSQAIVYPNECPGYYFFEMNADDYACETQAHYGKVPNYLQFRSAGDGC